MSIPVTITLNSTVGTPGPFSLYSCIESTCSGSLTPFVTGVSLSDLQTGSLVPDISGSVPTHVKIKSTGGSCAYEIIKPITGIPLLNCDVDIEYATVISPQKLYWNFATLGENTNYPTVMRFRIQKNGSDYINTTTPIKDNIQYIAQLQDWRGNTTVIPGDTIIFTVTTESSGSGGQTIGNMATHTTTGTSGYVGVIGTPLAPNVVQLNKQSVDPDGGFVSYSFTVTSGVNYALDCSYFQ